MTIWTIRLALLLFFLSILGWILQQHQKNATWKLARFLWTGATLVYVAHVLCAFHEVHDWSHSAAVEHTAEQSQKVTGIRFGQGIWFNHLFTALVAIETVWWWAFPIQYQSRSRWANFIIFGYLSFIAFNGAVIFAPPIVRWIAVVLIMILFASALFRFRKTAEAKINQ